LLAKCGLDLITAGAWRNSQDGVQVMLRHCHL
jgi:hypothetical protein